MAASSIGSPISCPSTCSSAWQPPMMQHISADAEAIGEMGTAALGDAAALGVIDHAVPPDDVLPRAVELAQRVAKYGGDRFCVGKHKERMHAPATAALRAETAAAGREYRSKL